MLSPSLYRELRGASVKDGALAFSEPNDDSQELVFVMHRVRSQDILFAKLLAGDVSAEDAHMIGVQLAENLRRARTEPVTGNYYAIFEREIEDVRGWMAMSAAYLPEAERTSYADFLEKFRTENRTWYEGELSQQLALVGDIHSHNAVFEGGAFLLMDTYPPKESWRISHNLTPYYRLGTDLWALGSKELFDAFTRGYEEAEGKPIDHRLDNVEILYAAVISGPYLYMLQGDDAGKKKTAERYHAFLRGHFSTIS